MSDFTFKKFSGFSDRYKRVLKKYKHSFEDDLKQAIKTIVGKFDFINPNQYRMLPNTVEIAGLGEEIKLPVLKMRVYIGEAGSKIGRLIHIFDKENRTIFLSDVYCKTVQENHDVERIRMAYKEYCEECLGTYPQEYG